MDVNVAVLNCHNHYTPNVLDELQSFLHVVIQLDSGAAVDQSSKATLCHIWLALGFVSHLP